MKQDVLIDFKNISKSFPGVKALKEVSFNIKRGEVHALVGENGAGKSTLIKIISGLLHKDSGQIIINGHQANIKTTTDAFGLGISCIYQELPLAFSLSVADNIFLGQEIKKYGLIDKKKQNKIAKKYFSDFDVEINPKVIVGNLSVSLQQITAIIKAIMKEATLFIMDEPTAALSEHEVDRLFGFIKRIKKKNISILYISHRMDEIFGIADRVTVLKDGINMGTRIVSEIKKEDLINMMSGKIVHDSLSYDKERKIEDQNIMEIENLCYENLLQDISFNLKKGEILGITGLVGSGKTELLKCIYGLYNHKIGKISLVGNASGKKQGKEFFGFIPEDRKKEGLFLDLNIMHNISISSLKKLSRFSFINKRKEKNLINKFVKDLGIKTDTIKKKVKFLSGGNQQKVILSRWLSSKKKVLLMDEPTRGIDILSKAEIYRLMNRLSKNGISIMFSSSDINEVLSISDRIAVMRDGRIVEIFERKDFQKDRILRKTIMDN